MIYDSAKTVSKKCEDLGSQIGGKVQQAQDDMMLKQMSRQLKMQNEMRERQMAMQLAMARNTFSV